ncbi:protein kinase domain-containing protein [Streptomyces europaeiscabiei]|uniref:protein kinase domain-containing protein n=1 Tax=Streptomyces europaeiscabiei TaxID=146819 RepID=UPI0029B70516|nr:protein kinase [Streptomyces europaeiscabiei]MDX2760413.1 protein kinase [Streptomyces europaeiscabiei]
MKSGELFSGRYQLVEVLGHGGFGEVWRAEDQKLRRPVALKILRADASGDVAEKRFRREATITARLQHPGLVVVYDVGQDLGRTFIVMELLEGADLAHVLRSAPTGLPIRQVIDVARQALQAIAAVHERTVIHRDLKPANLFLQADGRIKVCDFGIAYSSDSTKGLTPDGQVMGTFEYLSPEQCRAEQVDARSDLYSFGCVLYALLTGAPPFTGFPQVGLLVRHLQEAPRSPRSLRPDIPQELDDLVLGLLVKDPRDRRPASAEAVVKALGELALKSRSSTAGRCRTVEPAPAPAGATRRATRRSPDGTTLRTSPGAGSLLRGRYELLEEIAPRGPGGTWSARDRALDRRVTVRLLDATTSARLDRARFDRDARVGARARHPGLLVVHDTDWEGDQAFTVGEPVDADDLHGVLARSTGGLPLGEALQLSRSLAEALAAAHGDSVAHLGLTWTNVLRRPDCSIAVCDFGTTDAVPGGVGNGLFTAPEQWQDVRADGRADLYALGCLLYALYTARPPFRGNGPKQQAHLHRTQEAPLLRAVRPAVPAAVETLGSRLLAKEPDRRPTADETRITLAHLANDGSGRARITRGARFCAPVDAKRGTPYRAIGAVWSKGYHTGVDFPLPSGTSVRAVAAGSVVSAGWAGSFGYQVVLRHDEGIYSQYAHLCALSVKAGQRIDVGQRVGRSGSTGNSDGPHLHFEIRKGPGYGSDIDPVAFLCTQGVHLN